MILQLLLSYMINILHNPVEPEAEPSRLSLRGLCLFNIRMPYVAWETRLYSSFNGAFSRHWLTWFLRPAVLFIKQNRRKRMHLLHKFNSLWKMFKLFFFINWCGALHIDYGDINSYTRNEKVLPLHIILFLERDLLNVQCNLSNVQLCM